jgi:nucleotide-binding universal stress UspA family protein
MKRILVPTDFSEEAHHALHAAIRIAQKTGAAIKVLHAVEMAYPTTSFNVTGQVMPPDSMDQVFTLQLLETTKRRMHQLLSSIEHAGVDIVQEVDVDRVISKIKQVIEKDQVDLVVMGSKGSSGLDEFLIGSNTEKVVRSASCPVMTVKRDMGNFDIKEIVLASDFRREISKAVEEFKKFQEIFGARLHLVYINTPGAFESSSNIKQRLEQAVSRYNLQNYTINVYNDTVEEDGILHFASEVNADLIMMATHGRTGLAHLLSGSIAEDLVNHTSTPVLTYQI